MKTQHIRNKKQGEKDSDTGNNNILTNQNDSIGSSNVNGSLPTEDQVLNTIFDRVFIRGINLETYKRNFTNEQSGLYDALVKLFKGNNL